MKEPGTRLLVAEVQKFAVYLIVTFNCAIKSNNKVAEKIFIFAIGSVTHAAHS